MATLRSEVSSQHSKVRSLSTTETPMPTRSDMQPVSWHPILSSERPLQTGSSKRSRRNRVWIDYLTLRWPSTHSVNSQMVVRIEDPLLRRLRTVTYSQSCKRNLQLRNRSQPWELSSSLQLKQKQGAKRLLAVFLSRLDPETTEADMERFLQETHQLAATSSKLTSK